MGRNVMSKLTYLLKLNCFQKAGVKVPFIER